MILVLIIFLLIKVAHPQGCDFNVSSKTSPFIVNENYSFPTTFHFEIEEAFYVACPKGTFSTHIAEEGDHVVCKGGSHILSIGTVEVFDFSDIICTPKTTSTRHLNEPCENNYTVIEVGVEIYRDFVSEFSICFDEINLRPFYVKNGNKYSPKRLKTTYLNLYDLLKCPDGEGNCNFVDSDNVYLNNNLDAVYLNQEKTFQKLGVTVRDTLIQLPLALHLNESNYVEESSQRVQGYPYWEYVNFVPVWNTTWDLILYTSSNLLLNNNYTNFSYVGTLGVATLPDDTGNLVELYLLDNQMPVPKWIWQPFFGNINGIVFFYNSFLQMQDDDVEEVCPSYYFVDPNSVRCPFESVTAPEIKSFIANKCPNPYETYCQ